MYIKLGTHNFTGLSPSFPLKYCSYLMVYYIFKKKNTECKDHQQRFALNTFFQLPLWRSLSLEHSAATGNGWGHARMTRASPAEPPPARLARGDFKCWRGKNDLHDYYLPIFPKFQSFKSFVPSYSWKILVMMKKTTSMVGVGASTTQESIGIH